MSIEIEPPMPPKRLAQQELANEQKKSSGFFSIFKKNKSTQFETSSDDLSPSDLRTKLGLDPVNSISIEKLHERIQQDADSFADDLARQYEREQEEQELREKQEEIDAVSESSSVKEIPAYRPSMVSDDLLSASVPEPAKIPEPLPLPDDSYLDADVSSSEITDSDYSEPRDSPTSVVDESDLPYEQEHLDVEKEVESISDVPSSSPPIPDFLLSTQSDDSFSSETSEDISKVNPSVNDSSEFSSFEDDSIPNSDSSNSFDDSDDLIKLNSYEDLTDSSTANSFDEANSWADELDEESSKSDNSLNQDINIGSGDFGGDISSNIAPALDLDSNNSSISDDFINSNSNESSLDIPDNSSVKEDDVSSNFLTDTVYSQSDSSAEKTHSSSNISWADEVDDSSSLSKSSFLNEPNPEVNNSKTDDSPIIFSSPSNDSDSSFVKLHLDESKAEEFAKELSSSTHAVAKEHSINIPMTPFDMEPVPDISKLPVRDNLEPLPDFESFEEPKLKRNSFLSKLFSSKSSKEDSASPALDLSPATTLESIPKPVDVVESKSVDLNPVVSNPFPSNSVPSNPSVVKSKPVETSNQNLFQTESPVPVNPISPKQPSTLNSIIDSGKLDSLLVQKPQTNDIAQNTSSEGVFNQEEPSLSDVHHSYISSFAHEIDIIIDASKEAVHSGDLLLAKKKYNEAKQLYAASELEDDTRELLYTTLKNLFDTIHLKLLEEQAKLQIGE